MIPSGIGTGKSDIGFAGYVESKFQNSCVLFQLYAPLKGEYVNYHSGSQLGHFPINSYLANDRRKRLIMKILCFVFLVILPTFVFSQDNKIHIDEYQIVDSVFRVQIDRMIDKTHMCIISDSSEMLVLNLFEREENHWVLVLSSVSHVTKSNSILGGIYVNNMFVLLIGSLNENKFKKSGKMKIIWNYQECEQYEIVDNPVAVFIYMNGKLGLVQKSFVGCD
jgi:hypothetical protein